MPTGSTIRGVGGQGSQVSTETNEIEKVQIVTCSQHTVIGAFRKGEVLAMSSVAEGGSRPGWCPGL